MAGLQHLPISQPPSSIAHYSPYPLYPLDPQNALTKRDSAQEQETVAPPATIKQQDMAVAPSQPHHMQSAMTKPAVESSLLINKAPPFPAPHASSEELQGRDGQVTSPRPAEEDSQKASSGSVEGSNLQSSTVRNIYLHLVAHNGSVLDSFLQGVPDPSEWEVYVWQAPQAPPQGPPKGLAAQQYLQVARQWQEEVSRFVSYTQAAGELNCRSLCNAQACDYSPPAQTCTA